MDADFDLVSEDESDDESDLYQNEEDDDWDPDPTFDLVDATERAFSNLSVKKATRRLVLGRELVILPLFCVI